MPKFRLEEIEDYYTYYVQILGVAESVFWGSDLAFIEKIVENKSVYDDWLEYVLEKERERSGR